MDLTKSIIIWNIFFIISTIIIAKPCFCEDVSFKPPTPEDFDTINKTYFHINISLTNISPHRIGYTWVNVNHSFFNRSLVLLLNLNNRSELGENSTHIKDMSLWNRSGKAMHDATPDVYGKSGGAYSFPGDNLDYLQIMDNQNYSLVDENGSNAPLTVSAWIWMNDANDFDIVSKAWGSKEEWSFFSNFNQRLTFMAFFKDGRFLGRSYDKDLTEYEQEWHHVTAVYTGDRSTDAFRLFLDGERVDNDDYCSSDCMGYNASPDTDQDVTIGRGAVGKLDQVKIWRTALSASEVKAEYMGLVEKGDTRDWSLKINQSVTKKGSYSYKGWAHGNTPIMTEERHVIQEKDICSLEKARWSEMTADWEEEVILDINATSCEGRLVNYSIHTDEGLYITSFRDIIRGNTSSVTWRSEWMNDSGHDESYYFNVSLIENPNVWVVSDTPNLTVSDRCNATCMSLRIGSGYENICGVMTSCGEPYHKSESFPAITCIPEPPFGKDETHWSYENKTFGEEPYPQGEHGPYTHYVDNMHPNATDDYNPRGTHKRPRMSLPSTISKGSIVEIHGGPYGHAHYHANGTKENPIYIRGVREKEPIIEGTLRIGGSYYIIEDIDFDRDGNTRPAIEIGFFEQNVSHIAIRHNEIHNYAEKVDQGDQLISVNFAHNSSDLIRNILIYNNHIHHNNEKRVRDVKGDVMGVWIGQNTNGIWIVNNLMHHNGGDSIALMSSSDDPNPIQPREIYIANNSMHSDFENAIDLKTASDVLITRNRMYDYNTSIVFHGADFIDHPYQNRNITTSFNMIHNVRVGGVNSFSQKDRVVPYADEIYFIGNIVHDCHNDEGDCQAFASWDQNRIYYLNNVAHNCDIGGLFFGNNSDDNGDKKVNESITIINNIFGERHESDDRYQVNLGIAAVNSSLQEMTFSDNLFHESSGPVNLRWGIYEWNDPLGRYTASWESHTLMEFKNLSGIDYTGLLEKDPRFSNTSTEDYSLQWDSPAIDRGNNTLLAKKGIFSDYAGNPIYGKRDLGAMEYQPPYTIGDDSIDVPSTVRIYGDGGFRYINRSSITGNTSFTIKPSGGFSSYGNMDIRPTLFDVETTQYNGTIQSWEVRYPIGEIEDITFKLCSLQKDTNYSIMVDGNISFKDRTNVSGCLTFGWRLEEEKLTFTAIPSDSVSGCVHEADAFPCDGKIDQEELKDYLQQWLRREVTINDLLLAANIWG